MPTESDVVNVVVAGLGGQGVLTASDMLADAAFRAGFDVKKSEIHGMSQRGGSVSSDVRFGREVFSPMVPPGEADFLLVLAADQVAPNRHQLKEGGVLISPEAIGPKQLENNRSINVALLGVLSARLDGIPESIWLEAVLAHLPEKLRETNRRAFLLGRGKA
jgi:indolepyruvate ferredoxin oxidoreductase beta subunit